MVMADKLIDGVKCTLVSSWVPNELATAALRAANDQGISRAELMRRLLVGYLEYADYTE